MTNGYFSTNEVETIYRRVKNSEEGMATFIKNAKKVGTKINEGPAVYYLYKDEEKLFEVFQKHLSNELKSLGIDCFGRLMQYIS